MKTKFIANKKINYDGSQLNSHWILKNFNLAGDSIVSFIGSCRVDRDSLIDVRDQLDNKPIYSQEMLHFVVEFFDLDLEKTIFRQWILMVVIKEELERLLKKQAKNLWTIKRIGDDLFAINSRGEERKLSVSIATLSPVSGLIHTGLNITSQNTPVPAIGLNDLNIDPRILGRKVLESFAREIEKIQLARVKVKGVF